MWFGWRTQPGPTRLGVMKYFSSSAVAAADCWQNKSSQAPKTKLELMQVRTQRSFIRSFVCSLAGYGYGFNISFSFSSILYDHYVPHFALLQFASIIYLCLIAAALKHEWLGLSSDRPRSRTTEPPINCFHFFDSVSSVRSVLSALLM